MKKITNMKLKERINELSTSLSENDVIIDITKWQ